MTTFKFWLSVIVFSIGAAAHAQQALTIDEAGTVTIPGQLKAGSVQADNLDQTLVDLMKEVKGLKADIAGLNRMLKDQELNDKWFVYAPTVAAAMAKISDDDAVNLEFGILRNNGFRKAHFSSWNQGMRLMTEPYMQGDAPPYAIYSATYDLGGSMWLSGAALTLLYHGVYTSGPHIGKLKYIPANQACVPPKSYHMYYKYKDGSVTPVTGNSCYQDGPLFARKRLFR